MNLVLKTLRFSEKKHMGPVRKVFGIEYFLHPLAVSYIVANYKKSKHLEELLAASNLHDTLKDTDTIFGELAQNFTPLVATLVFELTTDGKEENRIGKKRIFKEKILWIYKLCFSD